MENSKNSGIMAPKKMEASEFSKLAAAVLAKIEDGVLDADIDVDAAFVSQGVLELEFSNGAKMVINQHAISQEIWVAARTGAQHFFWTGSEWSDTRTMESLLPVVSRLVSEMSGKLVQLS